MNTQTISNTSPQSGNPGRGHIDPKKVAPFVLIALITVTASIVLFLEVTRSTVSVYSGTIEAVEVRVGTELGGQVRQVYVEEGERIQAGQPLVDLRSARTGSERITSPIDGVVLERLVEPGEIASQGSLLFLLANLDQLTLTVYVPEDRYGQVFLGQACEVSVDSYPNTIFRATVRSIANQAEFTPRNVQTTQGRKSTVFAIRLSLDPAGGRLKPGMPADVRFITSQ
jgi:HlyD family secretion protein